MPMSYPERLAIMATRRLLTILVVGAGLLVVQPGRGNAQQVTGELGSPSATTTLDGKKLPAPNPAFEGVMAAPPPID